MPFDVTITEGLRSEAQQKLNVAKGVSWTMKSKHLVGNAVDMVPYPVNWKNLDRFVTMAEHVFAASKELGIPVKWGGTWSTTTEGWQKTKNFDGPHIELA